MATSNFIVAVTLTQFCVGLNLHENQPALFYSMLTSSLRLLDILFLLGYRSRAKLLENRVEKRETKYGSHRMFSFPTQPSYLVAELVGRSIASNIIQSDDANAPCLSLRRTHRTDDDDNRSSSPSRTGPWIVFSIFIPLQRLLLPTGIAGHRIGNRANFEKKNTFIALRLLFVRFGGFSIFFI